MWPAGPSGLGPPSKEAASHPALENLDFSISSPCHKCHLFLLLYLLTTFLQLPLLRIKDRRQVTGPLAQEQVQHAALAFSAGYILRAVLLPPRTQDFSSVLGPQTCQVRTTFPLAWLLKETGPEATEALLQPEPFLF